MATNDNDSPKSSPKLWSISYAQLLGLDEMASQHFGAFYPSKTMRNIVDTFVIPCCRRCQTSYSLSLNPAGLAVDAFISHSWDEPFKVFVDSIRKVFQTAVQKPNMWICAFALVQGNKELLLKQVSSKDTPLSESPFVKALQGASTFVVVRNAATDLHSRVWCVCELTHAQKLGFVPHKTHVTGPDCFSGIKTTCLDAKATVPEDKARILKVLLLEHDHEEIDRIVDLFRKQEAPDSSAALASAQFVGPTGIELLPLTAQERIRGHGNNDNYLDHSILTVLHDEVASVLLGKASKQVQFFTPETSITAIETDLGAAFSVFQFVIFHWLRGSGEPHGAACYNLACTQSLLIELQLCVCYAIVGLPAEEGSTLQAVAMANANQPLSHVAVGTCVPPEAGLHNTVGHFVQARIQAAQKCFAVAIAAGYNHPEQFATDRDLKAFRELSHNATV